MVVVSVFVGTPWKFNIENKPFQKESTLPPIMFKGLCYTSGVYLLVFGGNDDVLKHEFPFVWVVWLGKYELLLLCFKGQKPHRTTQCCTKHTIIQPKIYTPTR